ESVLDHVGRLAGSTRDTLEGYLGRRFLEHKSLERGAVLGVQDFVFPFVGAHRLEKGDGANQSKHQARGQRTTDPEPRPCRHARILDQEGGLLARSLQPDPDRPAWSLL